jgi:hypothetical protein
MKVVDPFLGYYMLVPSIVHCVAPNGMNTILSNSEHYSLIAAVHLSE